MITFPKVVTARFFLLRRGCKAASKGPCSLALCVVAALCLLGNCAPATEDPASENPGEEPGKRTEISHQETAPEEAMIVLHRLAEPPQPPTEAPEGAVTFVYYNLENYLRMPRQVDGTSVPDATKPPSEIAAVVSMIVQTQPDILAVCEIGDRDDVRDLQRRLKAEGLDLPHSEWMRAEGDSVRHLALLSRLPITDTNHATDLTYRAEGETLDFRRGIFDATLALEEGFDLRILGVHLKAKLPVHYASEEEMRRNEAHLLRRHIDAILAEDAEARLLVYGDFNDTRNSPAVRAIRGGPRGDPVALMEIQLADQYGFRWTHYWQEADLYSRIDYAMVSRSLKPHILVAESHIHHAPEWFDASDHRPLVIYIQP